MCLLQAFPLVGSPNALQISTYEQQNSSSRVKNSNSVQSQTAQPYCHSGRVHEAPIEVFQGSARILLRFEAHKAKLAELSVFGKLQRAVCHCAKGREHGTEPLLLHLHTEEDTLHTLGAQTR